jgi:aspartate/methionine/tyrosine aminotransferase
MVVPRRLTDTMNRLSQNMYINAPTLSQIAGIKAFECGEELDGYVDVYRVNRKCVLDTLGELSLLRGVAPAVHTVPAVHLQAT